VGASVGLAQTSMLAQPGDLVVGMNISSPTATLEQARPGPGGVPRLVGHFVDAGATLEFTQPVRFDNARGITKNAAGNLVALNFGPAPSGPGTLQIYATNGTDAGSVVYTFDGLGVGTITGPTRVVGHSVSPNNQAIAVYGHSTGNLIILEWDEDGAGGVAGDGVSATVTDAFEVPGVGLTGKTLGTAWLDNDTVIVGSLDSLGVPQMLTVDVDFASNTGVVTEQIDGFSAVLGLPGDTDNVGVAYTPAISPFIYVLWSDHSGDVTQNKLSVIDPGVTPWSVTQIDLSTSLNTGREIAFTPDGRLVMASFDDRAEVIDLDLDGVAGITSADTALLTDNSSVDYYFYRATANFSGLDIALGTDSTVPVGACCGMTVPDSATITTSVIATAAECAARGGTYSGDGTTVGVCVTATGACCLGEVCVETDEHDCIVNMDGTYYGDGSVCGAIDCTGACCLTDGTCAQLNDVDCAAAGGRFGGFGTSCDEIYCVAQGACCTDGVCTTTWSDDCTAQGGVYRGDGTTCAGGCDLPETEITRYDFDANVVGGRNASFAAVPDTSGTGGTFTSPFDVFGVVDRNVNNDFADDSLSIFPADVVGILRENQTGFVFGSEDVVNLDNPSGTGQATWTFDISGFSNVRVVMDFAAMGDFETNDLLNFTASIDGGAATPVFTAAAVDVHPSGNTAPKALYMLEGGALNINLPDPMSVNGTLVLNQFVRLASDNLGSGNTLTLTYDNATDGGGEVFIFDNIVLLGDAGGAVCACEFDGADGVNVFDLLAYLDLWFGQAMGADIDGDPGVDVFDLLFYLDCWFPASAGSPCP
jgi:hypothetical protein